MLLTGRRSSPRTEDAHKRLSLAFECQMHIWNVIRPHMHKGWLIIITVHKVGVLAKSSVGRKWKARHVLTQGCNPSPMANLPASRSRSIPFWFLETEPHDHKPCQHPTWNIYSGSFWTASKGAFRVRGSRCIFRIVTAWARNISYPTKRKILLLVAMIRVRSRCLLVKGNFKHGSFVRRHDAVTVDEF